MFESNVWLCAAANLDELLTLFVLKNFRFAFDIPDISDNQLINRRRDLNSRHSLGQSVGTN